MISLAEAGRQIKVVSDQVTGPTYTPDLASEVVRLINKDATGTFHVTNSDSVSWFQFACEIFEHAGLDCEISPTDSASFGAKAVRPGYSVLSNEKQEQVCGEYIRSWQDALPDYLELRAETTGQQADLEPVAS